MIQYFDNFKEEHVNMFKAIFGNNAEYTDNRITLHQEDQDVTFVVKYDNDDNANFYIEIDEAEQCFEDRGDSVYLLDSLWWSKVQNIQDVFEDYENGVEIYAPEYQ